MEKSKLLPNSRPPMAAAAPMHTAEADRPMTAMTASLCTMAGSSDGFVGGIEQAEMQPRIADQKFGDDIHQEQQQSAAADRAADQAEPDQQLHSAVAHDPAPEQVEQQEGAAHHHAQTGDRQTEEKRGQEAKEWQQNNEIDGRQPKQGQHHAQEIPRAA